MEYVKEKVEDVLVVRLRDKKVTSHEAPEMKTALLGWIIGEAEKILVNLKSVEAMDSTGLGSLLFGVRQADQHNKDLRFCEIQSKVKFLIHIAHLEEVIDTYSTEDEALANFHEDLEDE